NTAEIKLAVNMPCTMRRPNGVFAAYSSSKWTELSSPERRANNRTSSSVNVFVRLAVSPIFSGMRFPCNLWIKQLVFDDLACARDRQRSAKFNHMRHFISREIMVHM